MNKGTKTNYEFYCEYRGDELPHLEEIAKRARYECDCVVKLEKDNIQISCDKPFAPGEYIRKTVKYSNTVMDDLKKKLQKIIAECRDICIPYFNHLALTVESSVSGAELNCGERTVVLHVPCQKPETFHYNSIDFGHCVDRISNLLVQNADNPKTADAGLPDGKANNNVEQPLETPETKKEEENIMKNVELTKELATIIAVIYYRMSPKEQQDLRDNAAPEIVEVIKNALKLAAED